MPNNLDKVLKEATTEESLRYPTRVFPAIMIAGNAAGILSVVPASPRITGGLGYRKHQGNNGMNKVFFRGCLLLVVSILLGSLFFIRSYHDMYWSHPAIFILLTVIGVFSALCGGFLVGNSLVKPGKTMGSLLPTILIGSGAFIALAGGLAGLAAILLALAVSGTGYWGAAPYSYSGDYLYMGFQIMAFQTCVGLGIVGTLLLGIGLHMTRQEA